MCPSHEHRSVQAVERTYQSARQITEAPYGEDIPPARGKLSIVAPAPGPKGGPYGGTVYKDVSVRTAQHRLGVLGRRVT